jgi:hypothetical protein
MWLMAGEVHVVATVRQRFLNSISIVGRACLNRAAGMCGRLVVENVRIWTRGGRGWRCRPLDSPAAGSRSAGPLGLGDVSDELNHQQRTKGI